MVVVGVDKFVESLGMADGLTPEGVFVVIALAIILKAFVSIAYAMGNLTR